ncbi:phosphotransferase family protein [Deinococcus fonticola]|uniref:phosphotransferase family protein n=1 Tax=Deinococcus fonticola TaxID=2528713 RepID=UPI001F0EAA99|nr:phosphotransferase [Deinococcus fonticola]
MDTILAPEADPVLEEFLNNLVPDAKLIRAWPLTGGVSATVTALEFEQHGQSRRVVVRWYGERDLAAKPNIAAQEFGLLHFLHGAGLPVPPPWHHAPGVLVTGFVEGEGGVEGAPDPQQLAHFLAGLHGLEAEGLDLRPLPEVGPPPTEPDDSLAETHIREALAHCHPPRPAKPALLHGDFWPGNTLWYTGKLAAVIDWEDAALGDPLYDVGIARLELLFFHGQEVMQAFTDEYARLTGAKLLALPSWDLRAALRPCGFLGYWGHSAQLEAQLRQRHAWFVGQATAALT